MSQTKEEQNLHVTILGITAIVAMFAIVFASFYLSDTRFAYQTKKDNSIPQFASIPSDDKDLVGGASQAFTSSQPQTNPSITQNPQAIPVDQLLEQKSNSLSPTQSSQVIVRGSNGEQIIVGTGQGLNMQTLPQTIAQSAVAEKFDGYIVKLKDKSVAEKFHELAQRIGTAKTQNSLELKKYQAELLNKQNAEIKSIKALIPNLKVKRKFSTAFNGFHVNLTQQEAQKLRNKGYKVWSNREVKAVLMDSVPLINADKVWQLDEDGGQCFDIRDVLLEGHTKIYTLDGKDYEVTLNFVDADEAQFTINGQTTKKMKKGDTDKLADGTTIGVDEIVYQDYEGGIHSAAFYLANKDCLTGKDVKIAIIDTGVDYTHKDLGGCFGTKQERVKETEVSSSSAINSINPIITTANGNTYEIQLEIPSYLPDYLRHPTKIFSGRKIRLIKKSGNFGGLLLKSATISGPSIADKTLEVEKTSDNFFTLTIPQDVKSGTYSINFRDNEQIVSVPVDIVGISENEKNVKSQATNTVIAPIKRLQCNYCYWEAVLAHNPKNEKEGFLAGASNYLHQTEDSWDTYQKLDINSITKNNIGYFGGDTKLAFDSKERLNIAALGNNGSPPLNGVFYRSLAAGTYPVELEKTFLDKPPKDLPPEFWLIGDYPKIAIDTHDSSPYFNNIYLSVNAAVFKDNSTGQYQYGTALFIIKNSTIIKKKGEDIGFFQPANSGIVYPNGTLFFGRWDGSNYFRIFSSNNGGQSFQQINLPVSSKSRDYCSARVSTKSKRAWFLYSGPEMAIGKNGRLFATWSEFKNCKDDPSFEYEKYANDFDVFVSYSDDKGQSWSEPVRVNDDFSGGDQGFPSITIDNDGIIYVVFADHRDNLDKGIIDFYLSFSIDNGQSFSKNIKLNDISVPITDGGRVIGDYLDMVQGGITKVFTMFPCVSLENPYPDFPTETCIVPINKPIKFEPQIPPQCSDGIDNDEDELIDFPNDKGCESKFDDDESDETSINVTCKVAGGYDIINNDNDPMDDHGHGTHVAATAAGNGALKGVAPDADIYAYKVLDAGGYGSWETVIAGIERAIDPNQDGDFSDKADIISMSLGGFGDPDDPQSQAVDNAVNVGTVAVVAAGNSGPGGNPYCRHEGSGIKESICSPGAARNAITIGATDKSDVIASFSSRGPVIWNDKSLIKPDIVAPGVNICAAQSSQDKIWDFYFNQYGVDVHCLDNNHISISGTSMATPHVAGAAALLKQKNPTWDVQHIKSALKNTAKDIEASAIERGTGRIDALATVSQNLPPVAVLEPIPTNIIVIPIRGKIDTNDLKEWSLAYAPFNPSVPEKNWVDLIRSSNKPTTSELYILDVKKLPDGEYIIRLEVNDLDGQKAVDYGYIKVDKVDFAEPLNYDIYRGGDKVPVKLIINPVIVPREIILEYGIGQEPKEWIKTPNSNFWDTAGLSTGWYTLRVTIVHDGIQDQEQVQVYLDTTLKKGWPVRVPWEQSSQFGWLWGGYVEPVVSDLDGDGKNEVIVYSGGNPPKLRVYNTDGSLKWMVKVGTIEVAGGSLHIPLVDDVNNDGKKEIFVYNFEDPSLGGDLNTSSLYSFNAEGKILNGWPIKVPKDYHPTMLIADLNQDGKKEIVIQGNDGELEKVVIVSNNGKIISQWALSQNFGTGTLEATPAIGNFDEDKDLEVVVVKHPNINEGEVSVYNLDGTKVSGWPQLVPGEPFSAPLHW